MYLFVKSISKLLTKLNKNNNMIKNAVPLQYQTTKHKPNKNKTT